MLPRLIFNVNKMTTTTYGKVLQASSNDMSEMQDWSFAADSSCYGDHSLSNTFWFELGQKGQW